ncbi:MAG: thiamine phosphate synthase [Planctomycetes bacterium]|nr:thiamine phosphate synthase [Planctomycetota bacterium]
MSPGDGAILRLIDVNQNRLIEALRVVEDQARFGLCGTPLESDRLKALRHTVQQALAPLAPDALAERDVAHDPGRPEARPDTRPRANAADVLGANLSRAKEAIRTLEEHCKVLLPLAATSLSAARYELYALEQVLLAGPPSLAERRVYAIVGAGEGRPAVEEQVDGLLGGGVRLIQLREPALTDRALLALAERLVLRCREAGALLILNDRPDLARLAGASGVHVGRDDLPASSARRLLRSDCHIGASVHDASELKAALQEGPSYLGWGTLFASPTKPELGSQGLAALAEHAPSCPLPIYGIGGVTRANAAQVIQAGAHGVAVATDLVAASAIEAAARELVQIVTEASP